MVICCWWVHSVILMFLCLLGLHDVGECKRMGLCQVAPELKSLRRNMNHAQVDHCRPGIDGNTKLFKYIQCVGRKTGGECAWTLRLKGFNKGMHLKYGAEFWPITYSQYL